ncbi:MAG: hypothetical protein KAU28_07790, partial [Phycisphaerae bacterium]|nr:hypothetical protein [Phycisphaerae bacterium]
MIVKMRKVHVAARSGDRNRLLDALRAVGAVHLAPLDAAKAVAEEKTVAEIDGLRRALQILGNIAPQGETPEITAGEAAHETLRIQQRSAERRSRLAALHHQLVQLEVWGDVTLAQLNELRQAGIEPQFFVIPRDAVGEVKAEFFAVIRELPGKNRLVAVIDRPGGAQVPEQARAMPLPKQDRPTIRAEAAEIDAALKRDSERLGQLARLASAIKAELAGLCEQAQYTIAQRGGLAEEHLYAVQGWVPAEKAQSLVKDLTAAGLDVAIQALEPAEEDNPPTLIGYPRWARPIKGLFDVLGTLPGYRETDLSPFFMIALPIFAAMLIGDAGYGLLFVLAGAIFYHKLVAKAGKAKTHLVIVIGAVTMLWGIVTANYFGITPGVLGADSGVGKVMRTAAPLYRDNDQAGRDVLIQVSFIVAVVHLTLARGRKLLGFFPDLRFLAELGWCFVLWAMFGIVWHLFFIGMETPLKGVLLVLLGVGLGLAIVFTYPARN